MDKIKSVFSIAFHNLRRWTTNPRMYLIFIMLVLYLHSRISPINAFCEKVGYKITPYLFAFMMSETNSVLLIMLGIVLLFCDAPFIESDQPHIVMRSGRKLWTFGQVTYIVVAAVLYFFVVLLLSVFLLLPNLEFSLEWGKIIGTFAQTNVAPQHNITIPFDFSIYRTYTPLSAICRTFFNCWLISIFLGIFMFVLNLNIARSAGAIGAALLVLWQMAVSKTWTGFTKFSPVTWVSLSKIDTNGNTLYPKIGYIYAVILILLVTLLVISVCSMKKRDIDILKSV